MPFVMPLKVAGLVTVLRAADRALGLASWLVSVLAHTVVVAGSAVFERFRAVLAGPVFFNIVTDLLLLLG